MTRKPHYFIRFVGGGVLIFMANMCVVGAPVITNFSQLIGEEVQGAPITYTEYKALEPLCKLVLTNMASNNAFWLAYNEEEHQHIFQRPEFAMGNGANWLHHYCWGKLGKFRFFTTSSVSSRSAGLQEWQRQMDYCANAIRRDPSYAYRYIVFTELAESYYQLKNYNQAIKHARMAIEANKKYAKAYGVLADSYIKNGERDNALEVVAAGLKIAPDSKILKNRYAELKSKPPAANPGNSPYPAAAK